MKFIDSFELCVTAVCPEADTVFLLFLVQIKPDLAIFSQIRSHLMRLIPTQYLSFGELMKEA